MEPLAKRSEIVAEIRRFFNDTARQSAEMGDQAFATLRLIAGDMLERTERRLREAEIDNLYGEHRSCDCIACVSAENINLP